MVRWYDEIIAGGISGMAGVFIGHPFDTVKVLMQTDSKHKNPVQCLRSVVKRDGLRSLYNGILPPLAVATAINAILFFSYEYFLRILTKQKPSSNESKNVSPSLTQIFLAGSFAGMVQTGVGVPAEVIKCKQQAGGYSGLGDCVRKLYRAEGWAGFYRGAAVTAWRDTPSYGCYFAAYRVLKDALQGGGGLGLPPQLASIVAGGTAGCMTWAVVYPLDTVKSAMQSAREGSPEARRSTAAWAAHILRHHGPGFFFRGFSACMLRAVPVNAVIWPTYEATLRLLGDESPL